MTPGWLPAFIGPTELVIILVLALIIFGPGKLPDVGKAVGRGLAEFRRAQREAAGEEPMPPPPVAEKGTEARAESRAQADDGRPSA